MKLHKLLVAVAALLTSHCSITKKVVKQEPEPAPIVKPVASQDPSNFVINVVTDPQHPTIALIGEINSQTSSQFINYLLTDTLNGAKDVTIDITSPGGSVGAGLDMISAMKLSGLKSHCIAHKAMSMAFLLLQTCTDRAITSGGILMVHEAHVSIENANRYELRQAAIQLDEVADEMATIEAKRMHMKKSTLNKRIANKDWFADAKTALKYHMVDRIIP